MTERIHEIPSHQTQGSFLQVTATEHALNWIVLAKVLHQIVCQVLHRFVAIDGIPYTAPMLQKVSILDGRNNGALCTEGGCRRRG